jgi:hypothetical protein
VPNQDPQRSCKWRQIASLQTKWGGLYYIALARTMPVRATGYAQGGCERGRSRPFAAELGLVGASLFSVQVQ